jgi:hypothetical protein
MNPEDLGNAGEIEMQFAVKTVEHLEVSGRSLQGGSGDASGEYQDGVVTVSDSQ